MLSIFTQWEIIHPAYVLSHCILFTMMLLNLIIIIIFNNIVLLLLKSTMSRTFKFLNASEKHVYVIHFRFKAIIIIM